MEYSLHVLSLLLTLITNDSSVLAQGGTVTALNDKPPIVMQSESISIDVGRATVDANFVFRNPSRQAATVTFGFPEEGGGDIIPPSGNRQTWFKSFRSWVDGNEVQTLLRTSTNNDDLSYQNWWTKTVTFAPNQTRRVRNLYVTQHGSNTMSHRFLTYILASGAPWSGPIGSAEIKADFSRIPAGALYTARPQTFSRVGHTLIWRKTNFEPTPEDNIILIYLPADASPELKEAFRNEFEITYRR